MSRLSYAVLLALLLVCGMAPPVAAQVPSVNGVVVNGVPVVPIINLDGLTLTSTDGVVLQNRTAATAGVTVQISPRIRSCGTAWDNSASETVCFFTEVLPVTAATPTGTWRLGYSLNGAAATYPLTVSSSGIVTASSLNVGDATGVRGATSSRLRFPADGRLVLENINQTAGIGLDGTTDGTLKIRGTGFTAGTGSLDIGAKITAYNQITTAGAGVSPIVAYGDVVAATNTGTASIATFTPGADGTFEVGCNILITTATTHSFSCDVTYTDEGNTARTMIMPIYSLAGTPVVNGLIINTGGTVPYEAAVMTIRAKASTAITVRTSAGGTFTAVVYNARGVIKQIS